MLSKLGETERRYLAEAAIAGEHQILAPAGPSIWISKVSLSYDLPRRTPVSSGCSAVTTGNGRQCLLL